MIKNAWEYKKVSEYDALSEDELNTLGEEGWMLANYYVSFLTFSQEHKYIFQRLVIDISEESNGD